MEDIKVGEYVRTKKGKIIKFDKIGTYRTHDKDNGYATIENKSIISGRFHYKYDDIIKHSKNILDLIEVGDIVHTKDVLYEDYYHMFDEEMVQATKETIQDGIELVDILTHEQYNANCYRLED